MKKTTAVQAVQSEIKPLPNREWKSKTERGAKSVKLIHGYEQLDAISKATGEEQAKMLRYFGQQSPLNYILSLNFRNDIELDLPEGMPPLDPNELDASTHPDMMGMLSAQIHRLKNCLVTSNAKHFKKEQIFIQVLTSCPLKDAEILCAAKDKALEELYPTINAELVKQIFPSYVCE